MQTRTQPNNTRGRGPAMSSRPLYNPILLIAVLAFIVILVIAFAGAAIALGYRGQAVTLIKVPDDYPTIQAAMDAASSGTVIQVAPGTYKENLTLNKAVTLTAESFDQVDPTNNTTIIDGTGGGATVLIPSGLTQMPTKRDQ